MGKIIDKINKKENLIMTICILLIFVCIIVFFVIYGKNKEKQQFSYLDNLEKKVLTISNDDDNSTILLKEFSYYIIVAESNTQNQALFFGKDTPVNYWELQAAPLKNLRAIAKEFCLDTCIHDNILYLEAIKKDLELNSDDEKYLSEICNEIYKNLTADQIDTTDIELNDIYDAQRKIFLGEKYIQTLIDEGIIENRTEISVDGEYYIEEIKSQYDIDENKTVTDELLFGSITVNLDAGK